MKRNYGAEIRSKGNINVFAFLTAYKGRGGAGGELGWWKGNCSMKVQLQFHKQSASVPFRALLPPRPRMHVCGIPWRNRPDQSSKSIHHGFTMCQEMDAITLIA